MNVQPAAKRTFYIERHGDQYKIIKVWEAGAPFAQEDIQQSFQRVMETEPDERIIAEQAVGISTKDGAIKVVASDKETLESTMRATTQMMGEMKNEAARHDMP